MPHSKPVPPRVLANWLNGKGMLIYLAMTDMKVKFISSEQFDVSMYLYIK